MNKFNCTLIVDDDPVSCFINRELLSEQGLTEFSHAVSNGAAALDFIEKHCTPPNEEKNCPNVVLLDLNMPVMDGFEFLEELKTRSLNLLSKFKIVVLTSSTNPQDLEKAKYYNVDGYLNKPLCTEKLRAILAL